MAFDIEDAEQGVIKLTVAHDGFEPGSDVLQAISNGWPAVLASLKTLLETRVSLALDVAGWPGPGAVAAPGRMVADGGCRTPPGGERR